MAYEGVPEDQKPDLSALNARAEKALKAAQEAFKNKQQHDLLWQMQAEIFYPERADFTSTKSPGAERYDGIISTEPMLMRRDLAQNLGAMLRPRGREWFRAAARPESAMEDEMVKRWLEDASHAMRNIVYSPKANFSKALAESDHDYVTFGNAVVSHTYNKDQSGMLFSCLHLKDVAWSKNEEGQVDVVHQKMHRTLRQLVKLFGKEALPDEWQREITNGHLEQKKCIYRCVMPFDQNGYDPKEQRLRNSQFQAVYVAEGAKNPGLSSGEFLTLPFTIRTWMDVSGEDYGRSPCTSVALQDGRMLNVAEEALLTGIEMKVRPPRIVRKGLIHGTLSLAADTITYVDSDYDARMGDPITPVESGEPRYGMEFIERQQQRMGREFFVDLLRRLPEKEMTAYEAAEWVEQYVIQAAPIFEPMEAENAVMLDSVFQRAMARGAFGDVLEDGSIDGLPERLSEADIEFEFETPLSDAMRKLKAVQFDQLMGRVGVLLTSEHPEAVDAIDNVDFDAALKGAMDGIAPASWQKKKEDVDAIRQARADAQNAAKTEAMAMEAGQAALKARPENLNIVGDALGQMASQGLEQV
jgi:hypothetical protein